jgi:hypothetical protein
MDGSATDFETNDLTPEDCQLLMHGFAGCEGKMSLNECKKCKPDYVFRCLIKNKSADKLKREEKSRLARIATGNC